MAILKIKLIQKTSKMNKLRSGRQIFKRTLHFVIMQLNQYRGVQIFYKVLGANDTESHMFIHIDGERDIRTNFYTASQVINRILKIDGVKRGVDVIDEEVGVCYKGNTIKECALGLLQPQNPTKNDDGKVTYIALKMLKKVYFYFFRCFSFFFLSFCILYLKPFQNRKSTKNSTKTATKIAMKTR